MVADCRGKIETFSSFPLSPIKIKILKVYKMGHTAKCPHQVYKNIYSAHNVHGIKFYTFREENLEVVYGTFNKVW